VAAVAGIKGRLAHQAMDTGLGAQPAVGVIALEMDGGALDTRHFTGGDLDEFGLEATALAPAQVHAQQHIGPILGLSTAGAGLDIQEGVVGVHLAGEHAAEFQIGEFALHMLQVIDHRFDGLLVALLGGHIQQFAGLRQAVVEAADDIHHRLQLGAFAAQFLGLFGIVPNGRVFQLAEDLGQAFLLAFEVKGTPSGHRRAPAYRRFCCRWD
jgi:hypothetical protein